MSIVHRMSRYIPIVVVFLTGLAFSMGVFFYVKAQERLRIQAVFQRAATDRVSAIRRSVDTNLNILRSIDAFYASSPKISRKQFRSFVMPALSRLPSVRALEWIPKVKLQQRADYEEGARRDGYANFQITERKAQGKMERAGQRAEYFPVYYVEPYKGNELALGFDLASNRVRLEALTRSRDTGEMVSSGRILLVQETAAHFAFLVFHPVYLTSASTATVQDRRENLRGYALGVYNIDDIVEHAMALFQSGGIPIRIRIEDLSAPYNLRRIYPRNDPKEVPSAPLPGGAVERDLPNNWLGASTFDVGSRKWSVIFEPEPGAIEAQKTWLPWGFLAAGLLSTSLITAYLMSQLNRTYKVERLVAERTVELSASNKELEKEIIERGQAEEEFRDLLEAAPDGIIIVKEDGKIFLVNTQAENLFGYTRAELLGKPIEILVPEHRQGKHPGHRSTYLAAPTRVRPMGVALDVFARRKDGSVFPVEISLSPIKTKMGLLVTAAIRDITSRKQDQEEIAAKSRDLETLLHVTSHDLREPLRAIVSFSRIVEDRYAERLDEKGRDFLMRVIHGAQRMSQLLDDILALSRSQRTELLTTEVEGETIVREALKPLEHKIGETGARVQVATDLPRLWVDQAWATQALYNLISNALKFTRKGEAPDVEIGPYRLDGEGSRGVGIIVRDRGPGVAPEQVERMFKLFQRLVGREVEGTGAGLAIVQQVAERHGGKVWAQPRQGGGLEFIITFGRTEKSGRA